MTLNYNDIIKACDANISALETNDLDSFFRNVDPRLRGQIYVFMRDDLKLGERIYEYLHECPASIYKGVDSIPDKVVINTATSIGESAFENSSVGRIDVTSDVTDVGADAFKDCKNLRQVAFKNGSFKKFGSGAFVGCSSLKAVLCPESITDIDKKDFEGCSPDLKIGVLREDVLGSTEEGISEEEEQECMNWYAEHVVLYG